MGLVNIRRNEVGVRRHCGRQPRRGGIEDHPGSTGHGRLVRDVQRHQRAARTVVNP